MRIGLVCPYQWDVPGGVQYHVRDLAETLRGLGHHVEVLTPAEREESLPAVHVTFAGRAVPVPYNGSMASLQFGPVSAARVRRWLRDGRFDVVHVHEPVAPSVSLLVCMIAKGPIVATFHTATTRSKWLAVVDPWARPWVEKISGRIAVSDFARRVQVEHLGGDAVIIPNGVHVDAFARRPSLAGLHPRRGRPDDRLPRPVRRAAQGPAGAAGGDAHRRPAPPGSAAGDRRRGDAADVQDLIGDDLRPHVALLGEISEADKAAFLQRRRLLRAEPAGGVLRRRPHRGPGRRAPRSSPATSTPSPGCWRTARPACSFPRGDAVALGRALGDLLDDPAGARSSPRAGRRCRLLRLAGAGPPHPGRLRDGRAAGRRVVTARRRRLPGGAVLARWAGRLAVHPPAVGQRGLARRRRAARGLAAAGGLVLLLLAVGLERWTLTRLSRLRPRRRRARTALRRPAPRRLGRPGAGHRRRLSGRRRRVPPRTPPWQAAAEPAAVADGDREPPALLAAAARTALRAVREAPGGPAATSRADAARGTGPAVLQRRGPGALCCAGTAWSGCFRLPRPAPLPRCLRDRRPAAAGSVSRARRRRRSPGRHSAAPLHWPSTTRDGRTMKVPTTISRRRKAAPRAHAESIADRHRARQARHGRDAQGRRDHGRRHARAGEDRRGRRRRRRHGAGAGARRHPRAGRRRPDVRPRHDRRHHRGRLHPRHGQGPHRPLRRGAGPAGPRRRLRRRVRGAHPRRRGPPHRQVGVHRAVRLRRHQPRRGAAAHRRGRRHDPLQGRGRHRQRRQGRPPHAPDPGRDRRLATLPRTSCTSPPRSCRRRTSWSRRSPSSASCPSCCSPPAASPPRPTPR